MMTRIILVTLIFVGAAAAFFAWDATTRLASPATHARRSAPASPNDRGGVRMHAYTSKMFSAHRVVNPRAVNPLEISDATVREFIARAKQGDSEAMQRLADTLRECANVPRLSDDALTERQIDISLDDEAMLRDSGVQVDPVAQAARIQAETDRQKFTRDACASVSPAQSSSWIAWLQRAADAGNRDAEREYVDVAYDEFRAGVPAGHLEEALQRRDAVRSYAEDLLAGGDCSALVSLQWSVSQPLDAYRYHVAYIELTRRQAIAQGADPATLSPLDDFLNTARSGISESDRAAADASAYALLRGYCEG